MANALWNSSPKNSRSKNSYQELLTFIIRSDKLKIEKLHRRCRLISLEPLSKDYYKKRVDSPLLLKFFRMLQISHAVILLFVWLISLAILWLPDRALKKMHRRGFIASGHKSFPEPKLKGAFKSVGPNK